MRFRTLLLASLILLPSCAPSGHALISCGPWRPLLIGQADVLTDATARGLLAHNETGRALGCW